ncbi:uncharacterized protein LOC106061923 isoform X2 [Biomphalaria glabrata]|uniref:Uncharacterized protein LOC106061923 isoform X2 n=1 Tax=Biomphalaria glabrata TaxID=6526 RepID=A0A9W3AJL1_BIOGL|nr:uncharacterized protein LOC106061923 isoform X2 [Biomphalaria glabrata]
MASKSHSLDTRAELNELIVDHQSSPTMDSLDKSLSEANQSSPTMDSLNKSLSEANQSSPTMDSLNKSLSAAHQSSPTMDSLNKSTRKQHDPEIIRAALEELKAKKMSVRQASAHFNIPATTLHDKLTGKNPIVSTKRLLSKDEEEKLVQWLICLAKGGFAKSNKEVCEMAGAIIAAKDSSSESDAHIPTKQWLYSFYKRHPEVASKAPMSLSMERDIISATYVEEWFLNLQQHVQKIDPSIFAHPSRIFRTDELGLAMNPKSRNIVVSKDSKQVNTVTPSTKEQVTVLACTSAAGQYTPPLLVYPYKRVPRKNLLKEFPEAFLLVTDNGLIDSEIFFSWIKDIFVPSTSHLQKPILLLVDSHTSCTFPLQTFDFCKENNIIMYCILPQVSHLMQSLDQTFLGNLKNALSGAIREHVALYGKGVNLETFPELLKPVWDIIATPEIASSNFRAAGIYPLNPNRILKSHKLCSNRVYKSSAVGGATLSSHVALSPQMPAECSTAHHGIDPRDAASSNSSNSTSPSPSERSTSPDSSWSPAPPEIFTSPAPPQAAASHSTSLIPLQAKKSFPATTSLVPSKVSVSQAKSKIPISTSFSLNVEQLQELKEHVFFLHDEITRRELTMFFSRLIQPQTQKFPDPHDEDKFQQFTDVILSLVQMGHKSAQEETPPPATPNQKDTLKISSSRGKGNSKGNLRTAPALPSMSSAEESRQGLKRKINEKEQDEKKKLVNTLKKKEEKHKKLIKEPEKIETPQKNIRKKIDSQPIDNLDNLTQEPEKIGKQQKNVRKKIDSQPIDKLASLPQDIEIEVDSIVKTEMEVENVPDNNKKLGVVNVETKTDNCLGCGKRDGDNFQVYCSMCASWWHRGCIESVKHLNDEEIQNYDFMCSSCCPDVYSVEVNLDLPNP